VLERRGRLAEAASQYRTALFLGVGGDSVPSSSLGRRGARGGFLHNLGLLLSAQVERIAEEAAVASSSSSSSSSSVEGALAETQVARGPVLGLALAAALSALEEAAAAWPHLDSLTEVLTGDSACCAVSREGRFF